MMIPTIKIPMRMYEEWDGDREEGSLESTWHYYYMDDECVDPSENEEPVFRDDHDYYSDED
jgi:hypothetical protein